MVRVVLLAMLLAAACERDDSTRSDNEAAGTGTITVPPALPGEPSIGADREQMLKQFASNMSQGLYTKSNLLFLLCNTEAGLAVARQSGDPLSIAMTRRMVGLYRQGPGMANATCSTPPPQTP